MKAVSFERGLRARFCEVHWPVLLLGCLVPAAMAFGAGSADGKNRISNLLQQAKTATVQLLISMFQDALRPVI